MSTLSLTYSSFSPDSTISSTKFNTNNTDLTTWANGNIQQDNFGTLTGKVTWSQSTSFPSIKISHSGAGDTDRAAIVVESTTVGVLFPRMTLTQRDAISSPVEGLEIYNTTSKCKQVYTGAAWSNIGDQCGAVIAMGCASAPAGYLACDASAVSRSTYAELFAAIGTTFGTGDGSTTFNLPDTLGRALIGAGTGSGLTARTAGTELGAETHTLSGTESGTAAHSHSVNDSGHNHALLQAEGEASTVTNRVRTSNNSGTLGSNTTNVASSTTGITIANASSTSAASAHNNMQPSLVMKMYIKF